jgi:hypothetical protein
MLPEGEDKRIDFIYHNRSLQEYRHAGGLNPNCFVTLHRIGKQFQFAVEQAFTPPRSGHYLQNSNARNVVGTPIF